MVHKWIFLHGSEHEENATLLNKDESDTVKRKVPGH
jgi:hypothetical protein